MHATIDLVLCLNLTINQKEFFGGTEPCDLRVNNVTREFVQRKLGALLERGAPSLCSMVALFRLVLIYSYDVWSVSIARLLASRQISGHVHYNVSQCGSGGQQ